MTLNRCIATAALVALTACSRQTPEQQIVSDAADALGGRDRILAIHTLTLQGDGTQYNLGQDRTPGAHDQTFTVTGYVRTIDAAGGRARTELTRTPNFAFFQGPAAQKQVTGVDGDVAYNVAPNGNATRAGGNALGDRRMEILHHPITAVRAALDPMAVLANARNEGGESRVDVTTAAGQKFTLAIDGTNRLPVRVSHMADNTNLGDVVISTSFGNYQSVNDVRLPADLTMRTDDFVTAEYRLSNQSIDTGAEALAAPAAAVNAQAPAGPPPVNVTVEQLAPGLWWLAGGSHHSVLVEFADHLTLIETPQSDARARAVIAKARELVPDKTLTEVVNTHHHFDHSGGVRAAMSEGLKIITHEGNKAFFEEVASRPHTLNPDALQMNQKTVMIEGVSEPRELTDGTMTVQLIPIANQHSQTMLIAYVPRNRILVEVDVYTPGAAVQTFAADFLKDVQARNLRVDRIAPLHGMGPVPFAQLIREATVSAASTN